MRGLKALVIGMGVLIVAGLTAIAVGIATGAGGVRHKPDGFGHVRLPIPKGAAIVETSQADDRLVVRLRLADGTARLLLIDAATGRQVGTIDLADPARQR